MGRATTAITLPVSWITLRCSPFTSNLPGKRQRGSRGESQGKTVQCLVWSFGRPRGKACLCRRKIATWQAAEVELWHDCVQECAPPPLDATCRSLLLLAQFKGYTGKRLTCAVLESRTIRPSSAPATDFQSTDTGSCSMFYNGKLCAYYHA